MVKTIKPSNHQSIKPQTIKKILIITLLFFGVLTHSYTQPLNIKNDVFWNTKDGRPINSQGGGIFKFADPVTHQEKYYWYGVYYEEADTYRNNPSVTLPKATFKSVTCYSSVDLVNWAFDDDVFTKGEIKKHGQNNWVGRLGVAYIKDLHKYALFVQYGNEVLIAVADKPAGEFLWHQKINRRRVGALPPPPAVTWTSRGSAWTGRTTFWSR